MTQRRTILCVAILAASAASMAQGQTFRRDEVARALLEAEGRRDSFRIQYEPVFREGKRPAANARAMVTRLTDGQGRFRQETTRPPNTRNPEAIMQVETWDGLISAQEFYIVGKQTSARHNVMLTTDAPDADLVDPLGPCLGLRCSKSEQSVGRLLSDPGIPAEVRGATLNGRPIVEVSIVGPAFLPNAIITFRYDPQQQWLLLEWEMAAKGLEEGKSPVQGPTYFLSRNVNSEFHQIGDVWMPGRFDNDTIFWPGLPQEEKYHQITLLQSIELNPTWADADFRIDLASLPMHSQIVDARWGGTYRLGEDAMLLQGRLHQVRHAVNKPIDPDHVDDVILGATPLVEPALTAAGASGSGRSLSAWLRLVGYVMVAAGTVGAVVLFFRHRFGGA